MSGIAYETIPTALRQTVGDRFAAKRQTNVGSARGALAEAKLEVIREVLQDPAYVGGERAALCEILAVTA